MAGAAALLMYAGFRGTDPLTALRDVATGKPPGLAKASGARQSLWDGIGGTGAGSSGGVAAVGFTGGGAHPEFVRATNGFAMDRYSQARRWAEGYSDCSSFIGKALKACGIVPPGASVTGSYLVWTKLRTVDRSAIVAGDLLCGSGHIAMAIGGGMAIGQQNARQNVQVAPIAEIMYGQPSWVARRYVGAAGSSSGSGVAAA